MVFTAAGIIVLVIMAVICLAIFSVVLFDPIRNDKEEFIEKEQEHYSVLRDIKS